MLKIKKKVRNIQYTVPNTKVLSLIPDIGSVLDVGCYTGSLGKAIKLKDRARLVYGIEIDPDAAKIARKHYDKVVVADLDLLKKTPFGNKRFDCVIMADILEHLKHPEKKLLLIKRMIKRNGILIISVPNFVFILNRLAILAGVIRQVDSGIMDKSHLRLINKKIITKMVKDAGYRIEKIEGYFQTRPIFRFLGVLARLYPTIFAYQYVLIVKPDRVN